MLVGNRMERKTNQFLFLYPIKEYFDGMIDKDAFAFLQIQGLGNYPDLKLRIDSAKSRQEQIVVWKEAQKRDYDLFKPEYSKIWNSCIDLRYRKNNFNINYFVFDDCNVSDVVRLCGADKIVKVGLTFAKHTSKKVYPNPDSILNKLPKNMKHLRMAGFHMWDCVEKVAKRAHERGIDVLVDEDLTEFLMGRVMTSDFKFDKYPGYNPRKYFKGTRGYEEFMEPRIKRPWLLQDY